VQVLAAVYLAQDDVADGQSGRVNGLDRTQLARLDLPAHRVAPRPKLDCFPALQPGDVLRRPPHEVVPFPSWRPYPFRLNNTTPKRTGGSPRIGGLRVSCQRPAGYHGETRGPATAGRCGITERHTGGYFRTVRFSHARGCRGSSRDRERVAVIHFP